MALSSNDLQDHGSKYRPSSMKMLDSRLQFMQKINRYERYENTMNHLRKVYVDYAKISGLEKIVMIVGKNTSKDNDEQSSYPY